MCSALALIRNAFHLSMFASSALAQPLLRGAAVYESPFDVVNLPMSARSATSLVIHSDDEVAAASKSQSPVRPYHKNATLELAARLAADICGVQSGLL
jgi:hypothetical protein